MAYSAVTKENLKKLTLFIMIYNRILSINKSTMRFSLQALFCLACILLWSTSAISQCPAAGCATHTVSASTSTFPICGEGSIELTGDVDNNSDCQDAGGDNCFEFIITRHDPAVTGFFADIGKGNGCTGEADIFYTLVDGVCTTYSSSGSQNMFNFQYGVSDELRIYICDGSSGQVSLCNLCAECPDPKAIIEITPN
jgi:hypothetical protein